MPAYHLDRDGHERFFQVDLAYGLFDRTTVFLSLPAATQRSHDVLHGTVNTAYDIWGVGDGVIGLRQSLALAARWWAAWPSRRPWPSTP